MTKAWPNSWIRMETNTAATQISISATPLLLAPSITATSQNNGWMRMGMPNSLKCMSP